jgi:hypothetical protein
MANVNSNRGATRLRTIIMLSAITTVGLAGCDMKKLALGTTSKIVKKGQPAMKAESDYELAARAIPGSLKTVEAFSMTDPSNMRLISTLAEGYCQYGSGFVEDEWEQAKARKDFEARDYHARRAVKMYIRCLNYSLRMINSKKFTAAIMGDDMAEVKKQASKLGKGDRDAMLFVAMALGSAMNVDKRPGLLKHRGKVEVLVKRVVEIDEKSGLAKKHPDKALMPHVVLGAMYTAVSDALMGKGTNAKGGKHLETAMNISRKMGKDGKLGPVRFLLAKVYYARKFAVITQNRELFHKTLIEVLRTDPAIWPEQRLANEIAHRRARRYLKQEKELF